MTPAIRVPASVALALATLLAVGCMNLVSDAATRVRYAMLDASDNLDPKPGATITFTVDPDQPPDGCDGKGFTLKLIPYRGDKQVAVGDIELRCADGHPYWTGFGSEDITLAQALAVDKKPGEKVSITLRRTADGIEIIDLK